MSPNTGTESRRIPRVAAACPQCRQVGRATGVETRRHGVFEGYRCDRCGTEWNVIRRDPSDFATADLSAPPSPRVTCPQCLKPTAMLWLHTRHASNVNYFRCEGCAYIWTTENNPDQRNRPARTDRAM
jgi:transposase-like protein